MFLLALFHVIVSNAAYIPLPFIEAMTGEVEMLLNTTASSSANATLIFAPPFDLPKVNPAVDVKATTLPITDQHETEEVNSTASSSKFTTTTTQTVIIQSPSQDAISQQTLLDIRTLLQSFASLKQKLGKQ